MIGLAVFGMIMLLLGLLAGYVIWGLWRGWP